LSAHLSTCPRCQALVADLTALRQVTRSLEPQLPSPQVWTRLSAALEAERGGGLRLWGFTWQTLAASIVTLTLVAGLTWTGSHLARSMPAPVETASSGGTEFGDAEAEFTTAIAGLESITKAEQSTLDMDTADVVQANLTVIDGAISESRAAL